MKVLIITPYFYPKIGGLENYAFQISKGLVEKYGNNVVIITSNHYTNTYLEEKLNGLKIYRLPFYFKVSNTPINPSWLITIANIIRKERPEVINVHTPVPFISDIAAMWARFYRINYIVTYHSASLFNNKPIIDLIAKAYQVIFENKMLESAKKIIIYNKFVEKNHLKKFKNKIEYILPGVDYKLFNPIKKPSNETKNVLFVGNLSKAHQLKGLTYLLKSIKIVSQTIPNTLLYIVGDGDYIEYYKILTKQLNITDRVCFVGAIPNSKINEYYRKSDVFVLPTYSNSESFGFVLIEAMACKTPVIGSNIGGIPNVIEDEETGILVTAKDIESLAKAIVRVFIDKAFSTRLAENAYHKVHELYDWEISVEKTDKLFMELL